MRTIENIRHDFERHQELKRRQSGSFIGRLFRKLHIPEIPSLKPSNDFGDREISVYSGSVEGIDRITKVIHDHKTGRLPRSSGEEQPQSSDSLHDPAR